MSFSLKNRWLVLFADLFLCIISFVIAIYLHCNYLGQPLLMSDVSLIGIWYFAFCFFAFIIFHSYRGLIRHLQFMELGRLGIILVVPNLALFLFLEFSDVKFRFPLYFSINLLLLNLVLLLFFRFSIIYLYNRFYSSPNKKLQATMLYGIGSHSVALGQWFTNTSRFDYNILGFIIRNHGVRRTHLLNLPVFNLEYDDVFNEMSRRNITALIFPDYKSVIREKNFLTVCLDKNISVLVSPPIEDVKSSGRINYKMKPIKFEDLLGRNEIKINADLITEQIGGKVILITGAAGSIGSELVKQLHSFSPALLVLFDIAETPMHSLRMTLNRSYPDLKYVAVMGDIRNNDRLDFVFRTYYPKVVYHAAAYKHVPMMESNPCEAVLDNVLGTKNLADCSVRYGVERFLMISTDKAVNPTNIMGATKRIAEVYVQALAKDCIKRGQQINFVTTRFGNVLGSNGSVIPYFKEQIEHGGPVTVTDRNIVRYFMTIPEACRLVLEAVSFGNSGEIYVFDMGEPIKILDLAKRMIEMAGMEPEKDIEIKFTGLRPGEKMFEELLSDSENTLPTVHEKIKVASVRQYDLDFVKEAVENMFVLARRVDVEGTVRSMKLLIPEYKSKNSPFEKYD